MKNTFITILVSLVFNISFAQNMVKMKIERGTDNKELDDILDFENICLDKFEFSSKDIIGKNYEINI